MGRSFSDSDIEQAHALGVPREAADELKETQAYSTKVEVISSFGYIALFLLAALPALLLMSEKSIPLLKKLTLVPEEAVWVETMFPSGVLHVFLSIVGVAWILNLLASIHPEVRQRCGASFIFSALYTAHHAAINQWFARKMIQKTNQKRNPALPYLSSLQRSFTSVLGVWTLGLGLLIVGMLAWELSRISSITTDQFTFKPYFSFSTHTYSWEDPVLLTTGCNYLTKEKDLDFRIHFGDGQSANLAGSDFHAHGLSAWEAIQFANALLEERVPDLGWERSVFSGGIHKGKEKWSDSCFQIRRRRHGSEEDRALFDRIYRTHAPKTLGD